MRSILVQHMTKIKKSVPRIEDRIKINFTFGKDRVNVEGNELNEFLTEQIVRAIDFGFFVDDALLLQNEDFVLEFINVKEHTRRNNLKDVRARVIGTDGKALKTIENLTGSILVMQENEVGVIANSQNSALTIQAIQSLIQGAKHGNVFAYLEKQGKIKRHMDDDLGLKENAGELEDLEEEN